MAIKVASIYAEIGVTLEKFKAGMRSARASFGRLNESASESKTVLREAGLALTAFSVGTAALGVIAIKTFAEFQQSIANVASVLDGMDSDFEALEQAARKAAVTTIFTANQAADAMYVLGSAGLEAGQIFSALEPILALAAATQGDIADTARLVVANMVAFQIPFRDTTRVANTFAAAISNSQATLDKLINSTKFVAPVARSAGIAFEQMTAALGKLLDAGISASTAGVYLRGILLALQNPTARARGAIEKLKMTLDDVSPQVNDLAGIIENLDEANAGAVESGDELADIFGRRYTTAMQVLIRLGAPALREFEAAITGTNKAFELQQVQITTLKGGWLLIKSVVQDIAIAFGKSLAPALDRISKVTRGLFLVISEIFNSLPPSIQSAVSSFGALLGILISLSAPLLLFAGFLPRLVDGLKLIKASVLKIVAVLATLKAAVILGSIALAAFIAQSYLFGKGMEFGVKRPMDKFIAKQNDFQQMVDRSTKFLKLYKDEATRTGKVIQALAVMFPEAASGKDAIGRFTKIDTNMVSEQIAAQRKLIELEKERNIEKIVDHVNKLTDANKELNATHIENLASQKMMDKAETDHIALGRRGAIIGMEAINKKKDLKKALSENVIAIDENNKKSAEALVILGNMLGIEGTWEERVYKTTEALKKRGFALSEQVKEQMSSIEFQRVFSKIIETSDQRSQRKAARNAERLRSIREKTEREMTIIIEDETQRRIKLLRIEERQEIEALERKRSRLRETHPKLAESVIGDAIDRVRITTLSQIEDAHNDHKKRLEQTLKDLEISNAKTAAAIEAKHETRARRTLSIEQSLNQARIGLILDLNEKDAQLVKHRYESRIEQIKLMLEQEEDLTIGQRVKHNQLIILLEKQLQVDLNALRRRQAEKRKREDASFLAEKKRQAEESIRGRLIFIDNMISDVSRDLSDVILDTMFGGDTEADRRMRDRLEDLDQFHAAERTRLMGNAAAMIALEREVGERRRQIQQEANEEIGSAWTRLWEGIKRSFVRNILSELGRKLREFIADALKRMALLKLAEVEAAGGNSKLGMILKGIGIAASALSGNPLPAVAAGAQAGALDSPAPIPEWGAKKLAGGGTQVIINNDGLFRGALVMADDPEIMDRVVRNTIEPAMQRVMSEKVA